MVEYKKPPWGSKLHGIVDLEVKSVEEFAEFLRKVLDHNENHPYRVRVQKVDGEWVFRAPDPWVPRGVVGFISKYKDSDMARLSELLGSKIRIVEG